jgi:hypothetical protein
MKAYLITTGAAFALIFAAHVARISAEGVHLVKEPIFLGTSLLSLAVGIWAWRLLRRMPRA